MSQSTCTHDGGWVIFQLEHDWIPKPLWELCNPWSILNTKPSITIVEHLQILNYPFFQYLKNNDISLKYTLIGYWFEKRNSAIHHPISYISCKSHICLVRLHLNSHYPRTKETISNNNNGTFNSFILKNILKISAFCVKKALIFIPMATFIKIIKDKPLLLC